MDPSTELSRKRRFRGALKRNPSVPLIITPLPSNILPVDELNSINESFLSIELGPVFVEY